MNEEQHHSQREYDAGSRSSGEPVFLAVGKLHRPYGLLGKMLMSILTDFPERLQPGVQVYVGSSGKTLRLISIHAHGKKYLVEFEGHETRESVAELRNTMVQVDACESPQLPDGEYYHHQLLGLRVVRDEDDEELGTLAEIMETGANEVFIVRCENGPDILLPDIDSVVVKVDLERREIRVHLIPGLVPGKS